MNKTLVIEKICQAETIAVVLCLKVKDICHVVRGKHWETVLVLVGIGKVI